MLAAIGFLSVFSGANAQNVFVSPQTGKLIAALTSSQEVGFEKGWNSFWKHDQLPLTITVAGDTNNPEDFIDIILTDKNEVIDAIYNLRSIYPNILQINYDNNFTNNDAKIEDIKETKIDKPLEMFEEFYKNRSGSELDKEQKEYMRLRV